MSNTNKSALILLTQELVYDLLEPYALSSQTDDVMEALLNAGFDNYPVQGLEVAIDVDTGFVFTEQPLERVVSALVAIAQNLVNPFGAIFI